ncbi:MAG: DUF1987 domain-containing protein [Magnetococcales bacterium]|nr:DUF1987 domain-containing protein [Magnetococcales bacterium]
MATLQIDGTDRTPQVCFDFDNNRFSLVGESYPEDVAEFYGDLLSQLTAHFDTLRGEALQFDFNLVYFNSSTAKVVMRLFEALEEAAQQENRVVVNWHHEEDDDNMREMGEEFSEDLHKAQFNLLVKEG